MWEKEYHALPIAHGQGRQAALLSCPPSLWISSLSPSAGESEMQAQARTQLTPPTASGEIIAS